MNLLNDGTFMTVAGNSLCTKSTKPSQLHPILSKPISKSVLVKKGDMARSTVRLASGFWSVCVAKSSKTGCPPAVFACRQGFWDFMEFHPGLWKAEATPYHNESNHQPAPAKTEYVLNTDVQYDESQWDAKLNLLWSWSFQHVLIWRNLLHSHTLLKSWSGYEVVSILICCQLRTLDFELQQTAHTLARHCQVGWISISHTLARASISAWARRLWMTVE